MGNCVKGLLFLAVVAFALIGVATSLPDAVWEKTPTKLLPLRDLLAKRGMISEKFMAGGDSSDRTAEGPNPPVDSAPHASRSESVAQTGYSDSPTPRPSECPGGVCPVPGIKKENAFEANFSIPRNEAPAKLAFSPTFPAVPGSTTTPTPTLASSPSSFVPSSTSSPSSASTPSSEASHAPEPFGSIPLLGESQSPLVARNSDSRSPDTLPDLNFEDAAVPPIPSNEEIERSMETTNPISPASVVMDAAPSPTNNAATFPISTPSAPSPGTTAPSASDSLEEAILLGNQPGHTREAFLRLNEIRRQNWSALTPEDQTRLNLTLDRMAFDVFYLPECHILYQEYSPVSGETLEMIATRHQITPEFLAIINNLQIPTTAPIPAGRSLKIVEGPVAAEVSFSRMELLLTFNGLYAGRFKMGASERAKLVRGRFAVTKKIVHPEYNGPLENGQNGIVAGNDPNNPLGPCWIELTGGLGLQGTNRPDAFIGQSIAPQGGLIFSNKDITHLNILLPVGGEVKILD